MIPQPGNIVVMRHTRWCIALDDGEKFIMGGPLNHRGRCVGEIPVGSHLTVVPDGSAITYIAVDVSRFGFTWNGKPVATAMTHHTHLRLVSPLEQLAGGAE
jgi:hypothetical protein